MRKVSVIGGGIGGLAVAIRMAARGFNVTLFEANEYLGGKMGQIQEDGFRFDTGPSLFTQPQLIEELISLCKKVPENYFSYHKLEESCRYFFEDQSVIIGHANQAQFAEEVANKTTVKAASIKKHLDKSAFLYNATHTLFLEKSLHKLSTYLSFDTFLAFCKLPFLDLFTSMSKRNKKRFENPKVEQIFNRYATYNGSDPYRAPALLNLIPHLEFNQGAYFPKGGMRSIAKLLERLCIEMGVDIHRSTKVERIEMAHQKVTGVHTKNTFFQSDYVICNQDVYFVYDRLLRNKEKAKNLKKLERSTSAIIFYWGIQKKFENLKLHNIFFSNDYQYEFQEISQEKNVPEDPTIYVNITSKERKEDAPKNCENWFVMVNTPSDNGQDWQEIIPKVKKRILEKLSRMTGVQLESHIIFEKILDPSTIESKTASFQGALYGSASNSRKAAFFRHPNFSKDIKGLYFCGGSVHPGGGIPLALSSAKIVDDLIR